MTKQQEIDRLVEVLRRVMTSELIRSIRYANYSEAFLDATKLLEEYGERTKNERKDGE